MLLAPKDNPSLLTKINEGAGGRQPRLLGLLAKPDPLLLDLAPGIICEDGKIIETIVHVKTGSTTFL